MSSRSKLIRSIIITVAVIAIGVFIFLFYRPQHNIYVIIERRDYGSTENDILTLYSGDGDIIQVITVTPDDKVFCIPYNKLGYSEVVTIHSQKMDTTFKIETIKEYDESAQDVGEVPMSLRKRAKMNVGASVFYENNISKSSHIETYCGGERDYELWKDGAIIINLTFINYEGLDDTQKDNFFASTSYYDGRNYCTRGMWIGNDLTPEYDHPTVEIPLCYYPATIHITNADGDRFDYSLDEYLGTARDFSATADVRNGELTIIEN